MQAWSGQPAQQQQHSSGRGGGSSSSSGGGNGGGVELYCKRVALSVKLDVSGSAGKAMGRNEWGRGRGVVMVHRQRTKEGRGIVVAAFAAQQARPRRVEVLLKFLTAVVHFACHLSWDWVFVCEQGTVGRGCWCAL